MENYQINEMVRKDILARLDEIEQEHNVRILFAVESGSRAWGFHSPDSDYDVRFIYAHKMDWYVSIDTPRDVIELPIEGDLDINGWDLKKALQLLIKPNPVLLEWLHFPIVYQADQNAMSSLLRLAEQIAHQRPSQYHYLHLAKGQYRRFIEGRDQVKLKKYFYAIRPVLSLMWLREFPNTPLPMSLPELRSKLTMSVEVSNFIDGLLIKKATTRELGSGPRNSALDNLIEHEFTTCEEMLPSPLAEPKEKHLNAANDLFRELLRAPS